MPTISICIVNNQSENNLYKTILPLIGKIDFYYYVDVKKSGLFDFIGCEGIFNKYDETKSLAELKRDGVDICKDKTDYVMVLDGGDQIEGSVSFDDLNNSVYVVENIISIDWVDIVPTIFKSTICDQVEFNGFRHCTVSNIFDNVGVAEFKIIKNTTTHINNINNNTTKRYTYSDYFHIANLHYLEENMTEAQKFYRRVISSKCKDSSIYYTTVYQLVLIDLFWGHSSEDKLIHILDNYPRAELYYTLAERARFRNDFSESYRYAKEGLRFGYPKNKAYSVNPSVYTYKLYDELSIMAYYNEQYGESLITYHKLLSSCPDEYIDRTKKNMVWTVEKFQKQSVIFCYDGSQKLDRRVRNFFEILNTVHDVYPVSMEGDLVGICGNPSFKLDDFKLLLKSGTFDVIVIVDSVNWLDCLDKDYHTVLIQTNETINYRLDLNVTLKLMDESIEVNTLIFADDRVQNRFHENYSVEGSCFCLESELEKCVESFGKLSFTDIISKRSIYNTLEYSQYLQHMLDSSSKIALNMVKYKLDDYKSYNQVKLDLAKIEEKLGNLEGAQKMYFDLLHSLPKGDPLYNQIGNQLYPTLYKTKSWKTLYDLGRKIDLFNQNKEYYYEAITNLGKLKIEKPAAKIKHIRESNKDKEEVVGFFINHSSYEDFTQTVNSFLVCCQDVDTIDRWLCLCVGDSVADIDKVYTDYPFFIMLEEKELCYEDFFNKMATFIPESVLHIVFMGSGITFYNRSLSIRSCIEDMVDLGGMIMPLNSKKVGENYKPRVQEESVILRDKRLLKGYWPYLQVLPGIINTKLFKEIGYMVRDNNNDLCLVNELIEDGFPIISSNKNYYIMEDVSVLKKISKLKTDSWLNLNVVCRSVKEWINTKGQFKDFDVSLKRVSVPKYINLLYEKRHIFGNNNYSYRQDTICLYFKHLQLWNSCKNDFTLIIDGSTNIDKEFYSVMSSILTDINIDEPIVVQFFGLINTGNNVQKVKTLDDQLLAGYLVTKSACKILVDTAFTFGIKAYFHEFINSCEGLTFYRLTKSLVKSSRDFYNDPPIKQLEGYKFYSGLDSCGNDVGCFDKKSLEELKEICDNNPRFVGFNTHGWVKYKVVDEENLGGLYGCRGVEDGIYIKIDDVDLDQIKQKLVEKKENGVEESNITFTVTTCKRLKRFRETMDNLLAKCKDIYFIDRWICIDDNSTEEDRNKMRDEYPFFEFILKNADEKGHAKSMNMLWDSIKTDYVLHFEDDWKCFEQFKIKNLFELIKDGDLDQIVLRKNCWADHIPLKRVDGRVVYNYVYNHDHLQKPPQNAEYDKISGLDIQTRFGANEKYWWWPGFTLNPSIFNFTKIKNTIGYFKEDILQELFEYDYALRGHIKDCKMGYVDICIDHTGEVSSYALNNMKRYYD